MQTFVRLWLVDSRAELITFKIYQFILLAKLFKRAILEIWRWQPNVPHPNNTTMKNETEKPSHQPNPYRAHDNQVNIQHAVDNVYRLRADGQI